MSSSDKEAATPKNAAKKPESQLKSFISGGVGGACVVMVGHPFDLIKVRMQTSSAANLSTLGLLQSTLAREGIRGLYRGVGAPLLAVSPMFAICFWGYDVGQRLVVSLRPAARKDDPMSMADICAAGAFSAIPATAIAAPSERIKCLLQVQANQLEKGGTPRYAGTMDCAWQVLKEGGIRGLFHGSLATLLRDAPASVAWFGIYELVKRTLSASLGTPKDQLSPLAVLTAGGLAGMANWAVALPPDVIKSRWQTAAPGEYNGLWDVYRRLVQQEGYGALFKGIRPAMIRAFPANAACFMGMEVARKLLYFMD